MTASLGYYEVFNQANVRFVDLRGTPIERITPAGIKTSDAITGAFDRIEFRGLARRLKDK